MKKLYLLMLSLGCADKTCPPETPPASVVVTLENVETTETPTVHYTLNGGPSIQADSIENGEWHLGVDQLGTFVITVQANICPDDPDCICIAEQQLEVEVELREEGCHVETQLVELSLDEEDDPQLECLPE